MSKSIPVTDGTNVIYTIELKKDFGDLCKELTRLKISPDQKLCIVTDSNVAPLYAKEVQDQLSAVFSNVFLHIFLKFDSNFDNIRLKYPHCCAPAQVPPTLRRLSPPADQAQFGKYTPPYRARPPLSYLYLPPSRVPPRQKA